MLMKAMGEYAPITISQIYKAIHDNECRNAKFIKPVFVWPQVMMKYIAKKIGVPYRKHIETDCVIHAESRRLKTEANG